MTTVACSRWLAATALIVVAACSRPPQPSGRGVALLPLLVDGGVATALDPGLGERVEQGRVSFDEDVTRGPHDWFVHHGADAEGLLGLATAGEPVPAAEPSGAAGLFVPATAAAVRVVQIMRNRICRAEVTLEGDAAAARVVLLEFDDRADPTTFHDAAALRTAIAQNLVATEALVAVPDDVRADRTVFSAVIDPRARCHLAAVAVLTADAAVRVVRVRLDARSLAYTLLARPRPGAAPCRFVTRVETRGSHRYAAVLRTPASVEFPIVFDAREPVLEFALVSLDDTPIRLRATIAACSSAGDDVRQIDVPLVGIDRWTRVRVPLPDLAHKSALRVAFAAADGAPVSVAFASPFLVGAEETRDLDVVCVSLDTVRADRMTTAAGAPTSPNFARLAQRSAVFATAIAAASFTLPSHVTILSGQQPDRHGVNAMTDAIDAARLPFLPQEFSRAGYRTHALTGGGYVHPDFGFDAGFLEYGTRDIEFDVNHFGSAAAASPDNAPVLAELRAILNQPRGAPLFLFVHTYAAHGYTASDDDLRAVGADVAAVRAFRELVVGDNLLDRLDDLGKIPRNRTTMRQFYDASVRSADRVLGAVIAELERSGRLDKTLLVVCSDHGEELYEHGRFGHGHSVHEELLHVPLLVCGPGIVPRVIRTPVSLADVAPTLRELCGLAPRADEVDGRSLAASLRANVEPQLVPVIARSPAQTDVLHALRGVRFKLVTGGQGASAWTKLFDLSADPAELVDLAAQRPADVARIGAALDQEVERLRRAGSGAGTAALSPDAKDALRALGYLGGD